MDGRGEDPVGYLVESIPVKRLEPNLVNVTYGLTDQGHFPGCCAGEVLEHLSMHIDGALTLPNPRPHIVPVLEAPDLARYLIEHWYVGYWRLSGHEWNESGLPNPVDCFAQLRGQGYLKSWTSVPEVFGQAQIPPVVHYFVYYGSAGVAYEARTPTT